MADLADQMRDILSQAGERLGLNVDDAELIRLHSNALFAFPTSRVVVRIPTKSGSAEDANASLQVTHWLRRQGFPCVEPAAVAQPLILDGHAVSVWKHLTVVDRPAPTGSELGQLLRVLHACTGPAGLRPFGDPLIGVAHAALEHDFPGRAWLIRRIDQLRDLWQTLDWWRPPGLIHGDAHPNNLMRLADGGLVLGDWDHTAIGPPEWDLVQLHYFHRRFGYPADQLKDFSTAYGWDLRDWSAIDDLIAIRELHGLSPYIRTASTKPNAATELAYRVETLRTRDRSAPWGSST
ncbi:phosphotransferase family protein [Nonomuraea jabiensis]|uniref:phosphotransferase family protein n=1 Tax=Nonomuraea jabiensis TaxID=882448 RepID=UPI003D722D9D